LKITWICVVALLVPFCVDLTAQVAQEEKPCEAKSDWILKVQRPDSGWDVGVVDRTHKLSTGGPAVNAVLGFDEVVVTKYALRRKYFAFTEVVLYPCDHSVSLRTEHLLLKQAMGFSLHGKTFALALFGNCGRLEKRTWIAAGCDTYVTLTDTSGSGRFDLLRIGRATPESVPPWVTK